MSTRAAVMVVGGHNLPFVRALAQRVLVLCPGTAAESGNTGDVLDSPGAAYTKRLIDDLPRFSPSGLAGLARLNEDTC
jgi:ABC-type microcin C transport system duplicated ATPase subunit YejF